MKKQIYDYDVIVIGSGAGGSVAASTLSQAGKKVALVEMGTVGGASLYAENMPSKIMLEIAGLYGTLKNASRFGIRSGALGFNYPTIAAWKDRIVQRATTNESSSYFQSMGVTLINGRAHFLSPHEISVNRNRFSAHSFIIATGSSPLVPTNIQNLSSTPYLTAQHALKLTRPPKTMFIIGAGGTGCELATLFSTFGTKVYLADIAGRIVSDEDQEVSDTLQKTLLSRHNIKLLLNSRVVSTTKRTMGGIDIAFQHGGATYTVKADALVVSCGKKANDDLGLENAGIEYSSFGITTDNSTKTSVPHIYAVGDVTGPYHLTHTALHQSRVAAHNILHPKKPLESSLNDVTRTLWTIPEIAAVGLTENECIKRIIDFKKVVVPINTTPLATIKDEHEGFVKLIIDKKKKTLIGATIMAPDAGALIHELALAVTMQLTVADIARVNRAFPSWSDAIRSAAVKLL